ncbi:MAG: hypothetical protein ACXWW4_13530, partial [Candidatus Binatia bacterium]
MGCVSAVSHRKSSSLIYNRNITAVGRFLAKDIGRKTEKFEARNPKQIQNDKKQLQCSKREGSDSMFGFSKFEIYLAAFVSVRGAAFDIRISDFFRGVPSTWLRIISERDLTKLNHHRFFAFARLLGEK